MADIHGDPRGAPQMPQAAAGAAPVPYGGPSQRPEPPLYGLPDPAYNPDGGFAEVMAFPGAALTVESPSAHDIAAGLADAPYYPGPLAPINAAGDADAGGRDDVSGSVAGSVAAAEARFLEFQSDTYGQGSTIGDLMTFPPGPLDPGAGVGNTMPTAGFYDPPRDYDGAQGAPGYEGKAQ